MSKKIGIFQLNGCTKCFNETLMLSVPDAQVIRIDNPKAWAPESLEVAVIAGYVSPEDSGLIQKIAENSKKMIAYGSCPVTGGIFGLAYQKGQNIMPLRKIHSEIIEVHGCLGEIEELQAAIQGTKPDLSKKQCEICGRKSTCQYLDEVKRQVDLEESGDTCFNNFGYMCNGYIAKECKEQCVQAGAPCRGCKPLVDRPGLRFLGMFGTLMANVEVATEATGKGGTDKLADEDDDVTKALPDITGNVFRFDLPTSSLPIGKTPTTGTIYGDIFVGRLIEELPMLLGMMGGANAVDLTLDAIEAYEQGTQMKLAEKVDPLRKQLRTAAQAYQKAIKSNNAKEYQQASIEIRKLAGNMNLSRLYYGGFRTPISDEDDFENYKSQQVEFTAGDYQKGAIKYSINGIGVITAFALN